MNIEDHIMELAKEPNAKEKIREFLKRDYIPKKSIGYQCLMETEGIKDFAHPLPALPGMRCARIIDNDPQSGPLYCGNPGYIYGWSKKYPEVYYVMCKNCAHRLRIKLNEKT